MLKNSLVLASILILMSSIFFISCKTNNDEKDGPSGIAHYYIQNFSNHALVISYTKSPNLGSGVVETQTIQSNDHDQFFEDNILGENPKPTDSFSKIELKAMVNNELKVVYSQFPIDNDSWFILEQNLGDDMIGNTKYQLVISNEDLVF